MIRVPKSRQSVSLSESLRKKVEMYGLAAAAAGFGVAALASPAQGEVVYTPANKLIGRSGVILDFNHDGIADFKLEVHNFFADGGATVVYSHGGNRAFGNAENGNFISMLPSGYTIGPNSAKFKLGVASSVYPQPKKFFNYCSATSGGDACEGPWFHQGTSTAYAGFEFMIDGQVHYGWGRFKVRVDMHRGYTSISTYLTGYAYETVANTPIVTGNTGGTVESGATESEAPASLRPTSASLGMLSAGASALPLWRSEQQ